MVVSHITKEAQIIIVRMHQVWDCLMEIFKVIPTNAQEAAQETAMHAVPAPTNTKATYRIWDSVLGIIKKMIKGASQLVVSITMIAALIITGLLDTIFPILAAREKHMHVVIQIQRT